LGLVGENAKTDLLGVNFTLIGAIATRFLGGGSGLVEIGGVIFSCCKIFVDYI